MQSVENAMEQQQAGTWDSVEACLECITTCSVDDGECVTTCVRTHLGEEEELWTSKKQCELFALPDDTSR